MTFDPGRHLTLVSGKEYLEVKWRLVWFRDEWPCGSIRTKLVSHQDNAAVFTATVVKIDADGVLHGSATGFGSEDARGFGDYLEKAETKAIGRALAALGYGTQFTYEFELPESPKVSRSPNLAQRATDPREDFSARTITEGQAKMLYAKIAKGRADKDAIRRDVASFMTRHGVERLGELPGGQENVNAYVAEIDNAPQRGGQTATMQREASDEYPDDYTRDWHDHPDYGRH